MDCTTSKWAVRPHWGGRVTGVVTGIPARPAYRLAVFVTTPPFFSSAFSYPTAEIFTRIHRQRVQHSVARICVKECFAISYANKTPRVLRSFAQARIQDKYQNQEVSCTKADDNDTVAGQTLVPGMSLQFSQA